MGMTNWAYKYKEYLEGLKNNNVIGGLKEMCVGLL